MAHVSSASDQPVVVVFAGVRASLPTAAFKAAQRNYSDKPLKEGALQTSCAEALSVVSKSDKIKFDFLGKNFWPLDKFETHFKEGIPAKPTGMMLVKITVLGSYVLRESLMKEPQLILPGRPETVKTNPEKVVLFVKRAGKERDTSQLEEFIGEIRTTVQSLAGFQGMLIYKKSLPKANLDKDDSFFDLAVEVFVDANGSATVVRAFEQVHGSKADVTMYYGAFKDFVYNPDA